MSPQRSKGMIKGFALACKGKALDHAFASFKIKYFNKDYHPLGDNLVLCTSMHG